MASSSSTDNAIKGSTISISASVKTTTPWSRVQPLTGPSVARINEELNAAGNSVENVVEVLSKSGIAKQYGLQLLQNSLLQSKPLTTNAAISEHLTKHVSQEQATDLMNGVDNRAAAETLLTAMDPQLGAFAQSYNNKRV